MSIITNEEREYLLESMEDLLEKYDYAYTEDALDTIIDEWARNKENLIAAFKKHPNYIKDRFMIAFKQGFQRVQNAYELRAFMNYAETYIALNTDEMPSGVIVTNDFGITIEPNVYTLILHLRRYTNDKIDDETAQMFDTAFSALKIKSGQKTSRAVNKLCTHLGVVKDPDYNRKFARYADAINPLTVNYNVVLSINPLDYLTMSFGNSWSSCHTIDTANKRGMDNGYHGMYSSGTVSYMLDGTSMVLYTIDEKYTGDEYWNEPKINRQMFHYANNKLIQSRLYPQGNDGDSSAYRPYRNIVQEIISTIMDVPNLWVNKKGTSEICKHVYSYGTHYTDYTHFDSCNISFVKDKDIDGDINIGHRPICIECGCEHEIADSINCCNRPGAQCACCGHTIDEGDTYYVNGVAYCYDCVTYCEICDEYVLNGDAHWIERDDMHVCDDCLDRYYVWCEHCRRYVLREDATYVESVGYYVCDDCLYEHYTQCDMCGEYHRDRDITVYNDMDLCPYCLNKEKEKENK
jgi:hypothetical protein